MSFPADIGPAIGFAVPAGKTDIVPERIRNRDIRTRFRQRIPGKSSERTSGLIRLPDRKARSFSGAGFSCGRFPPPDSSGTVREIASDRRNLADRNLCRNIRPSFLLPSETDGKGASPISYNFSTSGERSPCGEKQGEKILIDSRRRSHVFGPGRFRRCRLRPATGCANRVELGGVGRNFGSESGVASDSADVGPMSGFLCETIAYDRTRRFGPQCPEPVAVSLGRRRLFGSVPSSNPGAAIRKAQRSRLFVCTPRSANFDV